MKKYTLFLLAAVILLTGCSAGKLEFFTGKAEAERYLFFESIGGYYLPDSDFIYFDLIVPLDHTNPDDGRKTKVVFGVLPASGSYKGMFAVATGGPGTSGLFVADSYVDYYDPSIPEHFDIVFFDQRGVGLSGDLQCREAINNYFSNEYDFTTAQGKQQFLQAAENFAVECVAEMGNPEILPYMGTAQVAEDLELFRQMMGEDKFIIYGESYGTQLAQTYAMLYPEHLSGMILDGPVDLALNGTEYFAEQAAAFNQVLLETLAAGNRDRAFAADIDGDALQIYAELTDTLEEGPITFSFPLPHGKKEIRTFTLTDLVNVTISSLYSEGSRMLLLRALASYGRDGDLVMLARNLYSTMYIDPLTLEFLEDPSFSDAVYTSVQAQDYAYFEGTPLQRAEAYLQAGEAVDARLDYMAGIFYSDLPTVFWPAALEVDLRPAPLNAKNIPTLVLASTADPATPYSNALSVFAGLDDGYLITQTGGPHVIYGWGIPCIDDPVTEFIIEGTTPSEREITCQSMITEAYIPLAPQSATSFSDPLEALLSADDQIFYLPEYYYWDLETEVSVGCPYGGTLTFAPSAEGESFTLESCAFSEGFILSGVGSYNYDTGEFILEVEVTGLATGNLTYLFDQRGRITVTGDYNGEAVDLTY
jgi:pimeloyl-ACP methyl ester carboxylesterase